MEIWIALSPVLLIFILLFVLKQSSVRASLWGLLFVVLITSFVSSFHLDLAQMGSSIIKGTLISAIVAYVLLFGILLFHLMNEMGSIKAIASFISQITPDPIQQVILLVIAFSPFVESVSGFGIAIIVVAPILIELGWSPKKATILSLLGLSAVPWGALATGSVVGASLIGIPLQQLGMGTAILTAPTFFYFAILVVSIAGGWGEVKRKGCELFLVCGTLALGIWWFSAEVSVELAGVLGASAAMAVQILWIQFSNRKIKHTESHSQSSAALGDQQSIARAIFPYLFLIIVLLVSRLIPPVEEYLLSTFVIDLPNYSFQLSLMYSPGFSILLTCVFTVLFYKIPKQVMKKAGILTMKQWIPVTLSTIGFVAISEIMSNAGMITMLANTSAATFGSAFLVLSPLIGGTGGFLTGSNTGSNAMFIKLQAQTAGQLGLPPDLFAYAQNASASHMTMASPSRVLLGVSVTGVHKEESNILKVIALIACGSLLVILGGILILY
ncbi:L-lactate permease [Ammoniphilus resinae]|uniref:L-lactate permease n=1 Tax=Ammoniphilus resinae TaxID=861532 RepID=A0ABS4GM65_9BACL|nr:L-lactate permease [Ammoniphilus resinae]MBP1931368.1 lactate permease [Ammoniphilus resinae]